MDNRCWVFSMTTEKLLKIKPHKKKKYNKNLSDQLFFK